MAPTAAMVAYQGASPVTPTCATGRGAGLVEEHAVDVALALHALGEVPAGGPAPMRRCCWRCTRGQPSPQIRGAQTASLLYLNRPFPGLLGLAN